MDCRTESCWRAFFRRAAFGVAGAAFLAALFHAGIGAQQQPVNVVAQWPLELLQESGEPEDAMSTEQASLQCPLFMEQDRHACCWTRSWGCPNGQKGSKGLAMNDGTLSFHCCCTEGFWEHAKHCPRDALDMTQEVTTISKVDCNASDLEGPDSSRRLSTEPKGCKVPKEVYHTAPVVLAQCKQIHRWEKLSRQIEPKNCSVDLSSKMMTCRRNDTCHGGEGIEKKYAYLQRTLKYDCGSSCHGSLLINCCNTCKEAQEKPESVGVDTIECNGCDTQNLQYAAQEAHCKFVKGAFKCNTQAACELGNVDEYCTVARDACDVYPCDSCTAPHLKAKCCTLCLKTICNGEPLRRMVCEGCEGPPEDDAQWWQFWEHVR